MTLVLDTITMAGVIAFVVWLLTGLTRAWRAERSRRDAIARLHGGGRRLAGNPNPRGHLHSKPGAESENAGPN